MFLDVVPGTCCFMLFLGHVWILTLGLRLGVHLVPGTCFDVVPGTCFIHVVPGTCFDVVPGTCFIHAVPGACFDVVPRTCFIHLVPGTCCDINLVPGCHWNIFIHVVPGTCFDVVLWTCFIRVVPGACFIHCLQSPDSLPLLLLLLLLLLGGYGGVGAGKHITALLSSGMDSLYTLPYNTTQSQGDTATQQ